MSTHHSALLWLWLHFLSWHAELEVELQGKEKEMHIIVILTKSIIEGQNKKILICILSPSYFKNLS